MSLLAPVGWLAVVLGLVGLSLHWSDPRAQVLIVAASGAAYLGVAPFVGLVILSVSRDWIGVMVAGVAAGGVLATYGPWYLPAKKAGPAHTALRIMTQNLLLGRADAPHLVREVEDGSVDVLFLQELTPEAEARLRAAGLDTALPHRWSRPDHSAYGAGIWSRFPLADLREYPPFFTATLSATMTLPNAREVNVVCVHPPAPWPREPFPWRTDLAAIPALVGQLPARPTLMGGDFNATLDHRPFRQLVSRGFRDAGEQAGRGIVRTWPANRRVPPVLGLDHVVTRDATAVRVHSLRTPGTDHRGLLVTVVLAP